ncbi:MAG: ATP-binding protein [Lachnospira sp.]
MKKRINLQYMILTTVAIIATAVMFTAVFYNIIKNETLTDLSNYTDVLVSSDAWGIVSSPENVDDKNITANYCGEIRITLVNDKGVALLDTEVDAYSMENHKERPEIMQAFKEGKGKAIRKSKTVQKDALYYAVLLDNGCVLRASKEVSSMTSLLISSLPVTGALCVVLFMVCSAFSHFLTKSIVEPIEFLARNMDAPESVKVYKELVPFVTTIRRQHEDIMKNANMRQEFTANVSHELKTPLTSISGYSELIENGMATGEDITRFAGEIHKSSKRLLTLINDIIRISELDATSVDESFEKVNLYDVAKSCVEMLSLNAEKNNINVSVTGEDVYVSANAQMMEELIYNLCDNAIRYNNDGGKVEVIVKHYEKDGKEGSMVQVSDNGIGISKENQERIFERFYRVDKSRSKSTGGTGLGLAIVKHIIAKHPDAHIELESEEGKGTTIRVIFW